MATLRQRGIKLLAKKEYMAPYKYANMACRLLWVVDRMECPDGSTPEEMKEAFTEFLVEAVALKVFVEVSIQKAEEEEKEAASQI